MAYPTLEQASSAEARARRRTSRPLRVLFVIPEAAGGASMIFAARQSESVEEAGIDGMKFFLASRTNPGILLRERRRLEPRRLERPILEQQIAILLEVLARRSNRLSAKLFRERGFFLAHRFQHLDVLHTRFSAAVRYQ